MAATGTPTPNLGLRIPVGTDPASVDDINYNSTVLDTKIGPVGNTSVQAQINALVSQLASFRTFKNNDTYGITGSGAKPSHFPGIITGGQKTMMFTIQSPYSLENIRTITLSQLNGSIRSISGYVGTANVNLLTVEGYTWSAYKVGNYMIGIECQTDTATSVANNTPLVLTPNSFQLLFTT